MDLVPCCICDLQCIDQGKNWMSVCYPCSVPILNEINGTSSQIDSQHSIIDGNGWNDTKRNRELYDRHRRAFRSLKSILGPSPAKQIIKKQYGSECPCGLIPSQCTYHS